MEQVKLEDFRFTREQMKFAITYINDIIQGRWPGDTDDDLLPSSSDIIVMSGKYAFSHPPIPMHILIRKLKNTQQRQLWIKALGIELQERLRLCGEDGKLLIKHYRDGKSSRELATEMGMSRSLFYKHLNKALWFVAGVRRKGHYEAVL